MRSVLDFLFPPICISCQGKLAEFICDDCWKDMLNSIVADYRFYFGFKVYSFFEYIGVIVDVIRRIKYRGFRGLIRYLSEYLTPMLKDEVDIVVPVPLHPARVRERGFSQTEALSKEISRTLKIPMRKPIFRHSYRNPQAKIASHIDRFKNIRGVFGFKERVRGRVLLVDDVITTGATFYEAANTLIKAGADEIVGLTIARA